MTSRLASSRPAGRRPALGLAAAAAAFLLIPTAGTGCAPSEPEATARESAPAAFDKSEFSRKEWAKMREMDREEMLEYKRKLREARNPAGKPHS